MAKSPATVTFIWPVVVEGAFEQNFKPVKLTLAKGVPVRFTIPAAEVKLDSRGKVKEITPVGAVLMGEQMRSATIAGASQRHGG